MLYIKEQKMKYKVLYYRNIEKVGSMYNAYCIEGEVD